MPGLSKVCFFAKYDCIMLCYETFFSSKRFFIVETSIEKITI